MCVCFNSQRAKARTRLEINQRIYKQRAANGDNLSVLIMQKWGIGNNEQMKKEMDLSYGTAGIVVGNDTTTAGATSAGVGFTVQNNIVPSAPDQDDELPEYQNEGIGGGNDATNKYDVGQRGVNDFLNELGLSQYASTL